MNTLPCIFNFDHGFSWRSLKRYRLESFNDSTTTNSVHYFCTVSVATETTEMGVITTLNTIGAANYRYVLFALFIMILLLTYSSKAYLFKKMMYAYITYTLYRLLLLLKGIPLSWISMIQTRKSIKTVTVLLLFIWI